MKPPPIKPQYIRLTEEANAIDYLEKARLFIQLAERTNIEWKWVVISLYSALYGFAICCLKGTNYHRVLDPSVKKHYKLISFKEAIKRCQDPGWMRQLTFSQELILSESEKESLIWLGDRFRNYFIHYIPLRWSIEIHGIPHIALDILRVIQFLALESGTHIYLNQTEKKRIKSLIHQSTRLIKSNKLYKENEAFQKKSIKD